MLYRLKERLQKTSGNDTSGNPLDRAKKCYLHSCAMATEIGVHVENRLLSCGMKQFLKNLSYSFVAARWKSNLSFFSLLISEKSLILKELKINRQRINQVYLIVFI